MEQLSEIITSTVKSLYGIELTPDLTVPEAQFGDLSTNVAMRLSKQLGKNPREIAEQIKEKLKSNQFITKVEVAGPGFINLYLTDTALVENWALEAPQIYKDKVVIAEYSDPNAFKALHAGHLYTTLVGNAVSNIIEGAGAKIYRLNYGGDVGLHAAKAMWGVTNSLGGEYPEKLNNVDELKRPTWISQRYVEGNTAYETDEVSKEQITILNRKIYALHEENDTSSDFAQIYWTCREWSYDGFRKLYEDLNVKAFDEFIPESRVTPLGLKTVQDGLEKGVFEKSDGAVIYSEEKSGLHTRVFITSKNLPLYEAKELGLAIYKWEKYKFDKSLVITANDIVEYMKVLFSAMTNFYPEVEQRTTHLTHGIIKLTGGRKMSSRKGNVLMADDIISDAITANEKSSGKADNDIAIGAIKYAFLKQRIGGDIIYDPEESVSLQGNSGPYLQYAHARARSILEKSKVQNATEFSDLTGHERLLARALTHYQIALQKAIHDLMPHHICTYLYELAQVFNRFYENSKVVGDEREDIRRALVERYADTLKAGLEILGVTAPNKM
ncbi:arginine--tRNA ligase [Candidatus Saccharibacteria bacterium]|nr:arginine--tRNA ligase [Candidatus Saccharibacteria bacterium]